MNCTPRYPVDYAYARGMLITHKPWNKHNMLEHILNNKTATIDMFLRMIDRKEVPSSVTFQYLTAMKYARQNEIEILVKEGVNHPDTSRCHWHIVFVLTKYLPSLAQWQGPRGAYSRHILVTCVLWNRCCFAKKREFCYYLDIFQVRWGWTIPQVS